jgi:putative transposase
MFLKSFKYRIYPDEEQKDFFERHVGCCRFVYNHFLALRSNKYKTEKKNISGFDCKRLLVSLKKEHPWLKEVNSQSLQQSVIDLEVAFRRFFKGLGKYPCFKKKRGKQSFAVPQNFRIEDNKLFIPKLKAGMKIKLHRPLEGILKTLTIAKEPTGKYYAFIICEADIKYLPKTENEVGIDLGLAHFAIFSTSEKIEHPKTFFK